MSDFLEAEVKEKLREEREKDWRKALRRSISVQKRLEIPRRCQLSLRLSG